MTQSGNDNNQEADYAMESSRFHMWRAIFALAHADHVITLEERQFMEDVMRREPFSDAQKAVLKGDIKNGQDIGHMFSEVTDQTDRSAFFYFARLLCWCDGDFAKQEQEIILKLKETHLKEMNFEKMIGSVDMELADEEKKWLQEDAEAVKADEKDGIQSFMDAFVRRFNSRRK
jgi:hypothetical protein